MNYFTKLLNHQTRYEICILSLSNLGVVKLEIVPVLRIWFFTFSERPFAWLFLAFVCVHKSSLLLIEYWKQYNAHNLIVIWVVPYKYLIWILFHTWMFSDIISFHIIINYLKCCLYNSIDIRYKITPHFHAYAHIL